MINGKIKNKKVGIFLNIVLNLKESFILLSTKMYYSLTNQNLDTIPDEIYQQKNITHLNLSNNRLKYLPIHPEVFANLEVLYLRNNHLELLPDTLAMLPQLKVLHLQDNNLKSLPENIGELTELKVLWVYNNALESLPESMGQLHKLEKLDVSNNQLSQLPASFIGLQQLLELDISSNRFAKYPLVINQLTNMKKLSSNNNTFKLTPILVKDWTWKTYEQAEESVLYELNGKAGRQAYVITQVEEKEYGWIFYYEASDGSMLIGAGPVVYNKYNGEIRSFGSGVSTNASLAAYEAARFGKAITPTVEIFSLYVNLSNLAERQVTELIQYMVTMLKISEDEAKERLEDEWVANGTKSGLADLYNLLLTKGYDLEWEFEHIE